MTTRSQRALLALAYVVGGLALVAVMLGAYFGVGEQIVGGLR